LQGLRRRPLPCAGIAGRPGQRGLLTLDFAMWFPPCEARAELLLAPACARCWRGYLIAPAVKPET